MADGIEIGVDIALKFGPAGIPDVVSRAVVSTVGTCAVRVWAATLATSRRTVSVKRFSRLSTVSTERSELVIALVATYGAVSTRRSNVSYKAAPCK